MPRVSAVIEVPRQDGLFGIEIEVEGRNLPLNDVKYWQKENDGSLRGGFPDGSCENVLVRPLSKDASKEALQLLVEAHKESRVDFSFRTSVHVHLNVQQLFHCELSTLLYTYLLLEPVFMNFCGQSRIGNRFCLRSVDAESVINDVVEIGHNGTGTIHNINRESRYSAVNMASMRKYGSLEFRGMRGTFELGVLYPWLDMLDAVRAFGIKVHNPVAVKKMFEDMPFPDFLALVFGKELAQLLNYEGAEEECILQHCLTIEVPLMYVDTDSHERGRKANVGKEEGLKRKMPNLAAGPINLDDLNQDRQALINDVIVNAPRRRRAIVINDFQPPLPAIDPDEEEDE